MSTEDQVSKHYSLGTIGESILAAARQVAEDPERLKADDLAPVDEFHIGGREATEHFIAQFGLQAAAHVLDIGCGVGGPARYLAASRGCRVDGIDLTPEYCNVATMLTEKVGLADRARFRQASALDLPFADGVFDAAYMIHVGMNISDKAKCYAEAFRVLKPGGLFGIYDILAGASGEALDYPVPWATTAETSFLAPIEEVRAHLSDAGFAAERETDRGEFALGFFERLKKQAGAGPPPIGLHLLMGADFPDKVKNMVGNVARGCCTPWEIISRKA